MRMQSIAAALACMAFLCAAEALWQDKACAEDVPALEQVPDNLPSKERADLLSRRQTIENENIRFNEDARVFNGKSVDNMTDAEYGEYKAEAVALQTRRNHIVSEIRAFNGDVARAQATANRSGKAMPYTVQFISARGVFSIENSDGSIFTNANIGTGRVARIDTGTRVTTGPTGRLRLLFPDETVFTIGPNSDIVMDEFVYDPSEGTGKILVRLIKGLLRFVTGKVAHRDPAAVRIALPVADLAPRGTDFETFVGKDGSGYIKLFFGMLEITPKNGGVAFVMNHQRMVTFGPDGTFGRMEPIK